MRGQRQNGKKEKSADVQRARSSALRILERADRTEKELRERLERYYLPEAVEDAIAYVRSYHYLDDRRYAANYFNLKGAWKSRRQLEQELLYKKGVSKEILEEVCQDAEAPDEGAQIRRWMEKKHVNPENADQAEIRRLYAFLLRRGFRSEDILRELKRPIGEEEP